MNKALKNVVENTIDLEFEHVQEENLKGMEGIEEYEKSATRCNEIYHILLKQLPEEYHDLLDELDSKRTEELCFEIRHYFKKGVIEGLTNLKYLEEAWDEINLL